MINRRSVRIKTMQIIYAFERGENVPITQFDTALRQNILSTQSLYLYILLIIREVANFVEKESVMRAAKFLPTEEDRLFSTKLLSNILIQYLNHDEEYIHAVEKYKLSYLLENVVIKHIYKTFAASEAYKEYVNSGTEFNYEEDSKVIRYLFEEVMMEDEVLLSHLEDGWPVWEDDADLVVTAVREVIRKSKNELKLHLEKQNLKEKFTELLEFAEQLFHKTIYNREQHEELIAEKLKNWESDRLAVMDLIILRMALSEMLYFPSIPLKVTINEYIDIARDYSTPKSKDFVNGVLDKLMRELKEKGDIVKTGRGLVEN
jgi:transcription antitermination protein NusB